MSHVKTQLFYCKQVHTQIYLITKYHILVQKVKDFLTSLLKCQVILKLTFYDQQPINLHIKYNNMTPMSNKITLAVLWQQASLALTLQKFCIFFHLNWSNLSWVFVCSRFLPL